MASSLSQSDVAKLLAEPLPKVRAELASKLALEIDNPRMTSTELGLAEDIVRIMARDVEVSVRQALAESLRSAARMPHDVAVKLANDVESVASPILTYSSILTDEDLTAIVHKGDEAKHAAIASRAIVSEKVSEALIDKGSEKTVARLMENNGAVINTPSMNKAVDRFSESNLVKEKMVKRDTLPAVVAERLVTLVSDNLQDYLMVHHEMSPNIAANLVLQSRERAVMTLSGNSNEKDLERMLTQMHQNKRLTPSLVLRSVCMGDLLFFEVSMAVLANVPIVNARILIHDAGRLGLKSLYAKTSLPPRLLPAFRTAVDVISETLMVDEANGRDIYRARVIERILTQYQDMGQDDMAFLVDKLGDLINAHA
ncbi:MAG: DUF2336 domain-containing protein [Alphaproteobacteria bacterium]|nr:DUF2336 domain-containing protein [Alphaproteobacteria bacterium]MBV8549375.1 DUF2336 domain-containing protein [Alphaproteobacteria bacterium]